jgi:hypothetical protein
VKITAKNYHNIDSRKAHITETSIFLNLEKHWHISTKNTAISHMPKTDQTSPNRKFRPKRIHKINSRSQPATFEFTATYNASILVG